MLEMMATGMLFWVVWFVASGGDNDSDSSSDSGKRGNSKKDKDK